MFPRVAILRIIGRLAFPIFAFMISEGARYTKNKLKYFLMLFGVGFGCQIVYFVAMRRTDMCIMITFSISVLLIYLLKWAKRVIFSGAATVYKLLSVVLFISAVIATYALTTKCISVDYGFLGCIAPVCASLPDMRGIKAPEYALRLDNLYLRLISFGFAILALAMRSSSVQIWSLLALVILLLYNGKRGKLRMKYFFYVFYPLHLGLIYGVWYLFAYIIK